MIELEHINFGYKEKQLVLYDINILVQKGECILLCGESGCGKTTVTKLINGLIPHFTDGCFLEGKAEAAGMRIADTELYELAKQIGSVFQNPKSQFFNLDTDSELAFGLENEGVDPGKIKRRMNITVESLHIQSLMKRSVFSLSGGEKQMLAFASVYAMEPVIYVLDEPTANLDEKAIDRLKKQIRLLKEQGRTVLIAEHRLYFLSELIDRAFYFQKGRLVQSFTGEEFRKLKEHERVEMGLRTLKPTPLSLYPVREAKEENGLVVRELSCGYKKEKNVVENINFSMISGEVLAVTGHNGVGKTTLIRCLCGLMKERSGQVIMEGKPLTLKERQRNSFMVMQDVNHQLFYDSVWNECRQSAFGGTENIEDILEQLDLLPYKDVHPMALSGGQKQRLAIATALLSGKQLLIFDEPTSGLDFRHMEEVSSIIRKLAALGRFVIVVSHDKEFMQKTCDRLLRLDQ